MTRFTRTLGSISIVLLLLPQPGCQSDDDEGLPPVEDICQSSCEHGKQCDPDRFDKPNAVSDCTSHCVESADSVRPKVSPTCFNAQGNVKLCVASLSCPDAEKWSNGLPEQPTDYPCKLADQSVKSACETGGSGGGAGGGGGGRVPLRLLTRGSPLHHYVQQPGSGHRALHLLAVLLLLSAARSQRRRLRSQRSVPR